RLTPAVSHRATIILTADVTRCHSGNRYKQAVKREKQPKQAEEKEKMKLLYAHHSTFASFILTLAKELLPFVLIQTFTLLGNS
ncbi:MAG: hypothetical protein JXR36_09035, partial [Bacteroidales bacterium]|nr:hypothetical protein [Bacteroidales bacterium]